MSIFCHLIGIELTPTRHFSVKYPELIKYFNFCQDILHSLFKYNWINVLNFINIGCYWNHGFYKNFCSFYMKLSIGYGNLNLSKYSENHIAIYWFNVRKVKFPAIFTHSYSNNFLINYLQITFGTVSNIDFPRAIAREH